MQGIQFFITIRNIPRIGEGKGPPDAQIGLVMNRCPRDLVRSTGRERRSDRER